MSVRKGIPDQHDHVAAKVVRRLARGIGNATKGRSQEGGDQKQQRRTWRIMPNG